MIVTILSALSLIFSQYFFSGKQLGLTDVLDKWYVISVSFAILLGVINLTRVHVNHIRRRREGWWNSIALLICMYGYSALAIQQTVDGPQAVWIYNNVITPGDSTMFALIAFFIASAAYRAFRVRTKEATVLLIAAVLVLLGRAPIGDAFVKGWGSGFWRFPSWGEAADWVMNVPNTGGFRAIIIGAAIGAFAVAFRILLGLERAHLGGTGAK
jgi:hypothetical protein